jgi:predicted metal-dependent phosphotriesterase family hydrolase
MNLPNHAHSELVNGFLVELPRLGRRMARHFANFGVDTRWIFLSHCDDSPLYR